MSKCSVWTAAPGQSTTEYGLTLALVAIGVIVALGLLGGNLDDLLRGVGSRTADTANTSIAAADEQLSVDPARPELGPRQDLTVDLGNGKSFTYKGYAIPNLSQSISTAGANGTTEKLLANFDAMVKALHEAGEITEADANQLLALSRQGHRLAALEKILEEAAAQAASPEALAAQKVTWDGREVTILQLHRQLGWTTSNTNLGIGDNSYALTNALSLEGAMPETRAFIEQYHRAAGTRAMQNPLIERQVRALSGEISYLTEVVDSSIGHLILKEAPLNGLREDMAHITTAYDAKKICQIGGGSHCRTQSP